jgi:hypothetical protein
MNKGEHVTALLDGLAATLGADMASKPKAISNEHM